MVHFYAMILLHGHPQAVDWTDLRGPHLLFSAAQFLEELNTNWDPSPINILGSRAAAPPHYTRSTKSKVDKVVDFWLCRGLTTDDWWRCVNKRGKHRCADEVYSNIWQSRESCITECHNAVNIFQVPPSAFICHWSLSISGSWSKLSVGDVTDQRRIMFGMLPVEHHVFLRKVRFLLRFKNLRVLHNIRGPSRLYTCNAPALFCCAIDWLMWHCSGCFGVDVGNFHLTDINYADDAVLFTDDPTKWDCFSKFWGISRRYGSPHKLA